MDIFSLLKEDHARIKRIFEHLEDTTEHAVKGRHSMMESLKRELLPHSMAEEEVLYQRLEEEEPLRAKILEGEEEHAVAERLLLELVEWDVTEESWPAKVKVLKEQVMHHIKEEEGPLFTAAKKILDADEAESMAEMFQTEKRALKSGWQD